MANPSQLGRESSVTKDKLFELSMSVGSREEFVSFLGLLNEDLKARPSKWQNNNLESYLSGMLGFTEDMNDLSVNGLTPTDINQASWKLFAQILLAASIYE
jgi:hypothetical protein